MSIDNEFQFEKMKEIGSIVANCLEYLKAKSVPGITTKDLDYLAETFLNQHGAISAPKSTYNFPGHVCISVEREAAHGIPSSRILKDGDLVNIDVSASKDGFYADNGESFVVGIGSSQEKRKLCQHVRNALHLATREVLAGRRISNIGRSVEQYAKKNKLSVIKNLGGHGVGLSLHEEPKFIGSFYDRTDKRTLKENLVIAVEPFISNGGEYVEESEDGWTLFHPTYYSAQKEHTMMVRNKKPYIFTLPTKMF